MLGCWINGVQIECAKPAVAVDDRGLQYGHGLFETMLLSNGSIRFLVDHLARLRIGCKRLGIGFYDELDMELEKLANQHREGVFKLVLTCGAGGRGYRAPANIQATRILSWHSPPEEIQDTSGIVVRWCDTRLARNASLAGMKHLNRLEQVLAQAEWSDASVAEGLMLDTEGELIGGTFSNIFLVIDGTLLTPDLRYSGVQGVMRKNVLAAARRLGFACEQRAVWPAELSAATEVFVTNAVRGLRSVRKLEQQAWDIGPIGRAIAAELGLV